MCNHNTRRNMDVYGNEGDLGSSERRWIIIVTLSNHLHTRKHKPTLKFGTHNYSQRSAWRPSTKLEAWLCDVTLLLSNRSVIPSVAFGQPITAVQWRTTRPANGWLVNGPRFICPLRMRLFFTFYYTRSLDYKIYNDALYLYVKINRLSHK